jgi:hypothetical protein
LDVLLIHEICHAVTPGGHGAKWMRRMEVAANRAEKIGDHAVAKALREEVRMYQESPKITAGYVYSTITDVLIDVPTATLRQVGDFIADDLGETRTWLFKKYPRFKAEFNKAKRELQGLVEFSPESS